MPGSFSTAAASLRAMMRSRRASASPRLFSGKLCSANASLPKKRERLPRERMQRSYPIGPADVYATAASGSSPSTCACRKRKPFFRARPRSGTATCSRPSVPATTSLRSGVNVK